VTVKCNQNQKKVMICSELKIGDWRSNNIWLREKAILASQDPSKSVILVTGLLMNMRRMENWGLPHTKRILLRSIACLRGIMGFDKDTVLICEDVDLFSEQCFREFFSVQYLYNNPTMYVTMSREVENADESRKRVGWLRELVRMANERQERRKEERRKK